VARMDGDILLTEWLYINLPLSVNFEDREADKKKILRLLLLKWVLKRGLLWKSFTVVINGEFCFFLVQIQCIWSTHLLRSRRPQFVYHLHDPQLTSTMFRR